MFAVVTNIEVVGSGLGGLVINANTSVSVVFNMG